MPWCILHLLLQRRELHRLLLPILCHHLFYLLDSHLLLLGSHLLHLLLLWCRQGLCLGMIGQDLIRT